MREMGVPSKGRKEERTEGRTDGRNPAVTYIVTALDMHSTMSSVSVYGSSPSSPECRAENNVVL